jgi:hypothetical protein
MHLCVGGGGCARVPNGPVTRRCPAWSRSSGLFLRGTALRHVPRAPMTMTGHAQIAVCIFSRSHPNEEAAAAESLDDVPLTRHPGMRRSPAEPSMKLLTVWA